MFMMLFQPLPCIFGQLYTQFFSFECQDALAILRVVGGEGDCYTIGIDHLKKIGL